MSNLRSELKRFIKGASFNIIIGEVESVDVDLNVIAVKLDDDIVINNVTLTADLTEGETSSVVIYPKTGSIVMIAEVEPGFYTLLKYSEFESLIIEHEGALIVIDAEGVKIKTESLEINEGKNGGLVKVRDLTKILTSFKVFLNAFKTVIQQPTIPTATPGAPDAFHLACKAVLEALDLEEVQGIENENVKH